MKVVSNQTWGADGKILLLFYKSIIRFRMDYGAITRRFRKKNYRESKRSDEYQKKKRQENEKLNRALSKKWEASLLVNVRKQEITPLSTQINTKLLLLTNGGHREVERGIRKMFTDRYPEMEELLDEEISYLINTTKEYDSIMGQKERPNTNTPLKLFEALCKLNDEMLNLGRQHLAVPSTLKKPNIIFRKIMVLAFMNLNEKFDIHKPKQNKGDVANLKQHHRNTKKAYEGEAVFINQKDRSYAELLQDVRTAMEINLHRNDVKNVRNTKKCDLLMTIKGERDMAEKIEESPAREMSDTIFRLSGKPTLNQKLYISED
ncbi:hypothetical protein HHI36_023944 [Cryptolaemus montrouzieri]|uniref:Uncharacterized protein n=1 Tax=Cryptolaemus montrouzieri TaxID=559131 RepID=A0ABD2N1D5_9CUCU